MCKLSYPLVFFCFFLSLFSGVQQVVGATDEHYIQPVTFAVNSENEETLSFSLGREIAYTLFTLDGSNPRLVIDFPGSLYKGEKKQNIPGSRFVTGVRSAFHQQPHRKTRIVIDLQPEKKVAHHAVFDSKAKVLRVVLTGEKTSVALNRGDRGAVALSKEKEDVKKSDPQPAASASKEKQSGVVPEIHAIAFDAPKPGEERIRFRLNGFFPPKISTKEDQTPQVLCDFQDTKLLENVEKQIVTGGNLVHRITTNHLVGSSGVQVVLDLSEKKDFDLQQIFFRDGNLFVLVVRELAGDSVPE